MTNPEAYYKKKAQKLQLAIDAIAGYMKQIQPLHKDISNHIRAVDVDLKFLTQDIRNFKTTYITINQLEVSLNSVIREAKQV